MDKRLIKRIIQENQEAIPTYSVIHRDMSFGNDTNYVLVGLRRAGKSYLLYQDIQSRLTESRNSAEDILYFNFEDERLDFDGASELGIIIDSYQELYPDRKPIVYFDEIQNIEGWEKFARRLADAGYRVMITGSNAKMLSTEIAGKLGGRYIPRDVFPFSFAEYLHYRSIELDENWAFSPSACAQVSKAFDDFFYEGGIAESFKSPDKREYLNSLYQKILIGDIVQRYGIRNPRVLRLLAKKLADSVMQPSSLTRLQHIVKSSGDSISIPVLKDYLEYMQDAYLFFSIPNLSSPASERSTIQKRYLADQGLLGLFLFQGETKILENIVAIELNRQFHNTEEETLLYYYSHNVEVDFVIPEAKLAIQASYSLSDSATAEREVGALIRFLKANPDYKACIVTRDTEQTIEAEDLSIDVVPVWKWLLVNGQTARHNFAHPGIT